MSKQRLRNLNTAQRQVIKKRFLTVVRAGLCKHFDTKLIRMIVWNVWKLNLDLTDGQTRSSVRQCLIICCCLQTYYDIIVSQIFATSLDWYEYSFNYFLASFVESFPFYGMHLRPLFVSCFMLTIYFPFNNCL